MPIRQKIISKLKINFKNLLTGNRFRKIKNKIPEILIISGIFCVGASVFYWQNKLKALTLDQQLLESYQPPIEVVRQSAPQHIYIKWFIDTDIETQIIVDNRWTISNSVASYLDQSARPGENGNIIIYGHNTKKILGNLRALKGNELVTLTTQDGKRHDYQIVSIHQVNPTETAYLQPTTEEILTLYTCSGFMDQKRFIVQAKPILLD